MMKSEFVSQTSGGYYLLCLLVGVAYAGFFYYRAKILSKEQKWILAVIRGTLVSILAFLLLNPLFKTLSSLTLKPKVVLLLDDSRSMRNAEKWKDIAASWDALRKGLESKGFETQTVTLDGVEGVDLSNAAFTGRKTPLANGLNALKGNFEGQHLTDVILLSDGIMNEGLSPTFFQYPFRIHTLGAGDSTVKKDAYIQGISANKIAYLGNDFTVQVEIGSYLLKGRNSKIEIKDNSGQVLSSSPVNYRTDDDYQSVSFRLTAKQEGKQRFIAVLSGVEGEHTLQNNTREFFVDVVNGKEKILLLAAAPHPDLKAIKSIIDKNEWFELKTKIVQEADIASLKNEVFDVLILHQFPDRAGLHTRFLSELLVRQKPVFFFPASQSDWSFFNGMQNVVSIVTQLGKVDKVNGMFNPGFQLFNVPSSDLFADLPPITVPFGVYSALSGTEVIMQQYISGINTGRPLLAVNLSGTRRMAVFLGDGLWHWRMEEFAQTQQHGIIDELILKTLQLIALKEEKGKLRIYPVNEIFQVDQKVSFAVEVYNDLYERIYEQDIELKIKGPSGEKKFDFRITPENSRFELSTLPPGVYTYEGKSKNEKAGGQFVVSDSDIELQNTTADFSLLRTIASENNGSFLLAKDLLELRNVINKENVPNKLVTQEDLRDIIHFKWIWFVLIVLVSVEWILRKYWGSY
jgi:hypothetical protein